MKTETKSIILTLILLLSIPAVGLMILHDQMGFFNNLHVKKVNKHNYTVGISNPKFHYLQIPQPPVIEISISVNGRVKHKKFRTTGHLVTSGGYAHVELQPFNPNYLSGTFSGDTHFKLNSVKGYVGFRLFIDGKLVKETGKYSMEYYFREH